MYNPLPKELTLGESEIHDIGLFAKEDIKRISELGITHVQVGVDLYRTPLGGFINHSNTPNCEKIELHADSQEPFKKKWNLITRQNIKKGEEITLHYTFYNI